MIFETESHLTNVYATMHTNLPNVNVIGIVNY